MVDYTQNTNSLFNNNSTQQLTGNTAGNTTGAYTQNTWLPNNFTAGLGSNFDAGSAGLANAANPGRWGGSLVAPMNGQQIQASGNFSALSGYNPMMVNPGNVTAYTSGTGLAGLGLNNMNLSGYMNPYTSQVINTSLDQINRQLAQANQATAGNAALSGAFGGDRAAIMQSENARNANDLAAQTIANLNSQNFSQAQAQANADIARQLQAGTTQAQLGLSAGQGNQLAGLQGANLQLGASNALANLGQALRSADTQGIQAEYQDWIRSQDRPLQVAQMQLQAGLSGLPYLTQRYGTNTGTQNTNTNQNTTGTQSGTQNSTMTGTGPQPSVISQVAGGIGTAAGLGGLLFGGGSGGGASGLIGGLSSLYNNTLGSNGLNLFGSSGSPLIDTSSPGFADQLSYGEVAPTDSFGGGYLPVPPVPPDYSSDFSGGDFSFARGGLIGYDDGGDVEDDSFFPAYDDGDASSFSLTDAGPVAVAPPQAAPSAGLTAVAPAPDQGSAAQPQNPYMRDDGISQMMTGTGGNSWEIGRAHV